MSMRQLSTNKDDLVWFPMEQNIKLMRTIDKQWKCGKNVTPQQTQGHGCKQLNTSGYYYVNALIREKYIHETIKTYW